MTAAVLLRDDFDAASLRLLSRPRNRLRRLDVQKIEQAAEWFCRSDAVLFAKKPA